MEHEWIGVRVRGVAPLLLRCVFAEHAVAADRVGHERVAQLARPGDGLLARGRFGPERGGLPAGRRHDPELDVACVEIKLRAPTPSTRCLLIHWLISTQGVAVVHGRGVLGYISGGAAAGREDERGAQRGTFLRSASATYSTQSATILHASSGISLRREAVG